MNSQALIDSLATFPAVLADLLRGLSDDDVRRKPEKLTWSILEIVQHLADEETEDFRKRLFLTLEAPGDAWPPVDPETWAVERRYNEGDLGEALKKFTEERARSIKMLKGLEDPDWNASHRHTLMGEIQAGDLLASWTVHDMLHLRQIAKRRYELLRIHAGQYRTGYAGEWK